MAEELRLLSASVTAADIATILTASTATATATASLSSMARSSNILYGNRMPNKKELILAVTSSLKDFLLLRRLCKWLPSLLKLHGLLSSLFTTPVESDELRTLLAASIEEINSSWEIQTLSSVPVLVSSVRELFVSFSTDQLDFLSAMGTSPELTSWLLARSSTEEFNRLLQVHQASAPMFTTAPHLCDFFVFEDLLLFPRINGSECFMASCY
jgi:hypothetical protein